MNKIATAQAAANKAHAGAPTLREAYDAYRITFNDAMEYEYILTIYKDGEPLQFTGKSEDAVVTALRRWMSANRQRVDGLTCRDCPSPYDVVLRWDGDYSLSRWVIWWDDELHRCFGWSKARKAFLDACHHKIVRRCQDCEAAR